MPTEAIEAQIKKLEQQQEEANNVEKGATLVKDFKEDIKKLQSLLQTTQEAGMPTEAIEAQIKKLEQQQEEGHNLGLSQVHGKLNSSENHEEQIADDFDDERSPMPSLNIQPSSRGKAKPSPSSRHRHVTA